MLVKKGTKLKVQHSRKGTFTAVAIEDFDTEKAEWYPVAVAYEVAGINTTWEPGESIPCRASFCKITVVDK